MVLLIFIDKWEEISLFDPDFLDKIPNSRRESGYKIFRKFLNDEVRFIKEQIWLNLKNFLK